MAVKDYRELIVWQKAIDLVENVYRQTAGFPKQELYGLAIQMRRAAVSIPSNIAEGQGRHTTADFLRFLAIANGSLKEVETQFYIARRLGYLDERQLAASTDRTEEIGRLISGLKKSLKAKSSRPAPTTNHYPLSTNHYPQMNIFSELSWRNLINQTTDDDNLPAWLMDKPRAVYAGFDPTADSLHVGHLMALMILRRFQKAGHRPIALVGGATGMIGDPSGKSEERVLLSIDALQANIAGMQGQLQRFLDFDCGDNSAVLVNNHDWMGGFGYLEFLRDVGKHFPVNVMLTKDSVKSRLERTDSGLSYTEFSYMLLQAYDFAHLNREYGCEIQVGGSDQWGNIAAGIDLARRLYSVQLYGMTCPLLTKSDGTKMGKTESGALWLDAEKTSPYQFYQYWINLEDADVDKCLRFFTDLEREEIESVVAEHQKDAGRRGAQRRLATELTRLVHGQEGLDTAERATEIFFGAEISQLDDAQLGAIFADVPSKELPRDILSEDGLPVTDAFQQASLVKSKGEARRIISQGGGYVNNRRIQSIDVRLTEADLASQSMIVLRTGKKKYALLRFVA